MRIARGTGGLLLALALAAAATSMRVQAWGGLGHRLVGLIAAEHLSPVASQNVRWLLGAQSLADVSSWADRYVEGNQQTFSWHFLNIPPDATSYDRDRDCPLQPGVTAGSRADRWRDCAVDRIPYHKARLADVTLDRADRAIALKFMVHLVGDLHQPFHALGVGRGGNDVPVAVFGSETCGPYPCNMHGLWDGSLIAHRALDERAYLAALSSLIVQKGWTVQAGGGPAVWAMESHDLGKAALLAPHVNADEAYYRAQISVVDERLALAGLRLAAFINEALSTAPPRE